MGTYPVTELLADTPEPKRAALERIVERTRALVPDVTEGMSYGMPALIHRGWPLLSVMPTKKFLSIYPYSSDIVSVVLPQLPEFEGTKGSIHFDVDHQIPDGVLDQIIALAVERTNSKRPR